jgi:hypothetical protein
LTAGIAHEIKNPLNFVNNFSGVSTELIDELRDVLSGISIDHKARTEINELTDTEAGVANVTLASFCNCCRLPGIQ